MNDDSAKLNASGARDTSGAPSRSLRVESAHRRLTVRLPGSCKALSWAIVGGGLTDAGIVTWWQVSGDDLLPGIDPVQLVHEQLERSDLSGAIAMMTSRRLDRYIDHEEHGDGISVRVIATVGLSNGVAIGDPATYREAPSPAGHGAPDPGTINILCHISVPLTDEALVEAMSLVVEARTAAVLEQSMSSPLSRRPITGTGTDCVVVTCPKPETAGISKPLPYVGKHGVAGSVIGAAVRRAVLRGCREWCRDRDLDQLEMSGDQ